MLSEKRIEKLWADDLRLSYAADMPGMPRMQDVLRFARLVEAAALENAAKQDTIYCHNLPRKAGEAGPHAAWGQGCADMTRMLRARARAARKAAEENDDAR